MLNILYLNKQQDLEAYKEIIRESSFHSAYNRTEYLDVFCGGINDLVCFVFRVREQVIILPGYLKPIKIHGNDTEYLDFYTPYGYTGPFYSNDLELLEVERFWVEVKNWLSDNNVVSEFIRFNLFDNFRGFNGNIHETMLNIKGKILDEETQWSNFEHKVRKNVKKAIREGLTSKIYYTDIDDTVLNEFYNIYIDTMKRTNAADFFFYSLQLFKEFIYNNQNLCAVCTVYDGDIHVSSELLLISNNSVFSFLGGTLGDHFDKRPNDFLKYEVINWARKNSFEFYVLGGGYGYEDGIFKYKKSFFPTDVVTYMTGRLIIDKNSYSNLLQETNEGRIKKDLVSLDLDDQSFFPLYNKQN